MQEQKNKEGEINERIRLAVKAYEDGIKLVNSRRKTYYEDAKPLIIEVLEEIAKGSGFYVKENVVGDNFESISFETGTTAMGILIKKGNGDFIGIERGAALIFSLSETGNLVVWSEGHATEIGEAKGTPERELVRVLEPNSISKEMIKKFVAEFLEWSIKSSFCSLETSQEMERRRLGFDLK